MLLRSLGPVTNVNNPDWCEKMWGTESSRVPGSQLHTVASKLRLLPVAGWSFGPGPGNVTLTSSWMVKVALAEPPPGAGLVTVTVTPGVVLGVATSVAGTVTLI